MSASADWCARQRELCPGLSLTCSVFKIPAAKALFRDLRHLALLSPRIQPIINGKARQVLNRKSGCGYRGAIKLRLAHHLADDPDRFFLDQRQLITLDHDPSPFIN